MGDMLPAWAVPTTRFLLFTGKGGVGKTTIAAATAVALADAGLRVLLVATDPASNLSDVLDTEVGLEPQPVAAVPGLFVMDLDPQQAASRYRELITSPYRGVLPSDELVALEERLAGACTVEVAAFDTFARLLVEPEDFGTFDHVVFDTAPTGHTLRLLSLPAAWSDYLGANPAATTCLGPMGGLQDHRPVYQAAVEALADGFRTNVVLVTRPDRRALEVASAAAEELGAEGITNQRLVVNGVLAEPLPGDAVAQAFADRQRTALEGVPGALSALPRSVVPLLGEDLVGIDALRRLSTGEPRTPWSRDFAAAPAGKPIADLVEQLEAAGRGVLLVTGKGGVGKTTVASLVAAELVARGHRAHLATTDPAARPTVADSSSRLTTSAIDPEAATAAYISQRVAAARHQGLSEAQVLLVEEDLRSPCSQEVAVFQEFRKLLRLARDQFVVIDTAPTGHTLLLLDVTGDFHRQAMAGFTGDASHVTTPLMQLQDRDYSRVVIVTLAETTPVNEASELQDDLRRAGIEPFGWVLNATLAGSGTADPVLRARAGMESELALRVSSLAEQVWELPWSSRR
jgi:arsenite-transporting ATPase